MLDELLPVTSKVGKLASRSKNGRLAFQLLKKDLGPWSVDWKKFQPAAEKLRKETMDSASSASSADSGSVLLPSTPSTTTSRSLHQHHHHHHQPGGMCSVVEVRPQSSPVDYKGLQDRLYDLCLEESITEVDSEGIMRFHSESQFRGAFLEMNALRESEQLCDVVLEVEGEMIPAHRVVLASLSPYFRAMFTGEMAESKKKTITINGVGAESLRTLVEYAYTATIKISENNVQAILPAASVLQFEEVKRACSQFLKRQLDTDNCLGIKVFAEVHSCQELLSAATNYSSHYFPQVRKKEEFLKLSYDDLKSYLSNDQLNVSAEYEVYEAAIVWLLYKEERKKYVQEILNLVRLPLLDAEQLLMKVGKNSLVLADPRCVKMLMDALQSQVLPAQKANVSFIVNTNSLCARLYMFTWIC